MTNPFSSQRRGHRAFPLINFRHHYRSSLSYSSPPQIIPITQPLRSWNLSSSFSEVNNPSVLTSSIISKVRFDILSKSFEIKGTEFECSRPIKVLKARTMGGIDSKFLIAAAKEVIDEVQSSGWFDQIKSALTRSNNAAHHHSRRV